MTNATTIAREISKLGNLKAPVDVVDLVYRLGGNINYVYNPQFDAYIEKSNHSFLITVDSSKPLTRQRFSIAHEIAHLIIHLDYFNESVWKNLNAADTRMFRYGYDLEEKEANEFAAELLMPSDEFINIANMNFKNSRYYLEPIANYFKTSIDSVRYRGHNLKLWDMN